MIVGMGVGILEIGALLAFLALVIYGFLRQPGAPDERFRPGPGPPPAPDLTAADRDVIERATSQRLPPAPREPTGEPGIIENLIGAAHAKASAMRDKAETEAIARRIENAALKELIKGEHRQGD